jgi:hypothetical protein
LELGSDVVFHSIHPIRTRTAGRGFTQIVNGLAE